MPASLIPSAPVRTSFLDWMLLPMLALMVIGVGQTGVREASEPRATLSENVLDKRGLDASRLDAYVRLHRGW